MAAKIKLGERPKSFTKTVTFDMLDGTQGSISVSYKYRTRTEFGAFIDKLMSDAQVQVEPEKFSMKTLMERTAGANATYILDVIEGWNLDEEFNQANVQVLSDTFPGAAAAIMETYRQAITEGRLGN